ncbi:hypothetical protein ACJX0J_016211, partial [Zea mays]
TMSKQQSLHMIYKYYKGNIIFPPLFTHGLYKTYFYGMFLDFVLCYLINLESILLLNLVSLCVVVDDWFGETQFI